MKTKTAIILMIVFFPLFFNFVSCGTQKAGWKGIIEEKDGLTIVKNPKQGLWDFKEKKSVSIVKERQIGRLEGPEEFLFGYIADVAVNSKGGIYAADRKWAEVRKFNRDGDHLLTLGRRGQGPGEFQTIKIISVNEQDDLIVYDNRMGRISIFSDDGELIKTTKRLMSGSWIGPSKIFPTDGDYVLFGKKRDGLKLFHRFDQEWNTEESYIDYEFIDNKEFEKLSLIFHPGNCFIQKNGDILYTKFYCDNKIYMYRNKKLVKIITRESNIKHPYEVHLFHDRNKAREMKKKAEYNFSLYSRGKQFIGKSNLTSLGVFRLTDGKIANFVSQRISKDEWELYADLYDPEGKLLSHSKLGENLSYDIQCKDSNDLFYAIQRHEYHKVIVFRLRY